MINKISTIELQGANFLLPAKLPLFDCGDGKNVKATLLYGRNGSGKSTIARAFLGLAGENINEISVATAYDSEDKKIELSEQEQKSIFVFNEDFVNRNVRIQEDGLGTIVMLGEQVELADQIEVAKEELNKAKNEKELLLKQKETYLDEKNPASPSYYIERIKKILKEDNGWANRDGKIRGLSRNSNVTDSTYKSFISASPQKSKTDLIVEFDHKYQEFQDVKNGSATIDDEVPYLSDEYEKYKIDEVVELLKKEIDKPELTERELHLLDLAQQGKTTDLQERIEYFSNPETEYCPYCLQDVTQEYKESLVRKVQTILTDELEEHQEKLREMLLPEIECDLDKYSTLSSCKTCKVLAERTNSAIEDHNSFIQSKIDDSYSPITVDTVELETCIDFLDKALMKLEEERITYNKGKEIEPIKDDLFRINNEIAYYDVDELCKQHDVQVREKDDAEQKCYDSEKVYEQNKTALEALDAKRRRVDIAVGVINSGLEYIFFTDKRLSIQENGDSYGLLSNGKQVLPKNISVGERNIIGLCYFFATILQGKERETAYKDEYLIVIDDPVSSYDLENKVGILSFLKYKLGQFLSGNNESKAIVLTHDLMAFFDMEKILADLNVEWTKIFPENKTIYTLYELKNCSIERFRYNKRDEYTELMKTIYNYGSGDTTDQDIVIGNKMRQVLEAFSTFVYKKGIRDISTNDFLNNNMDEEYRPYFHNLMYRLVLDTGSHKEDQARNMDLDFFSLISDVEKQGTAKAVLCFIYLLNKKHVLAHLDKDICETVDFWCEEIKGKSVAM